MSSPARVMEAPRRGPGPFLVHCNRAVAWIDVRRWRCADLMVACVRSVSLASLRSRRPQRRSDGPPGGRPPRATGRSAEGGGRGPARGARRPRPGGDGAGGGPRGARPRGSGPSPGGRAPARRAGGRHVRPRCRRAGGAPLATGDVARRRAFREKAPKGAFDLGAKEGVEAADALALQRPAEAAGSARPRRSPSSPGSARRRGPRSRSSS